VKVQNKVILVTGGGNGIGRELVLNLLSKGARVAAVDIDESALQEIVELVGNKKAHLSTHVVNITNQDTVATLPDQIIARHGAVDGIINNAGIIQPFVRINDLDYATIDKVMKTNFYGTLYMIKAFLPHLLKRPEAHIINVSSMGGFLPFPGQSLYGATKAAVKLLTEGLHSELLNTNVQVTVVFPGAIGTNIAANSGVTLRLSPENGNRARFIKPLAPDQAAQIIIKGIEQNRYRIFVGSDSAFLDFAYRVSPERAAKYIGKQMQSLLLE
jgi:NAD(P)-dependent dehydrogenase (short-subunit alcohol dehydrogenase family)